MNMQTSAHFKSIYQQRDSWCVLICVAIGTGLLTLAAPSPANAQSGRKTQMAPPSQSNHDDPRSHPYLGMWVTEDGGIRHELLPNGRYDEQRGQRKQAYQGRYWIRGNQIAYLDDTGFTADGEFRGSRFYHGGYVFFREGAPPAAGR